MPFKTKKKKAASEKRRYTFAGNVLKNINVNYAIADNQGEGKKKVEKIEKSYSFIKKERLDRTSFVDAQGEEVELTRGLIWIETVPIGNEVTY